MHTVIIDCAPISFLDAVGVNTLKDLVLDFDKCDVQVLLAAMTSECPSVLMKSMSYNVLHSMSQKNVNKSTVVVKVLYH